MPLVELFAERGDGATSIADICARAGLTKGGFYSNFANKDRAPPLLLTGAGTNVPRGSRRALPGDEAVLGSTHDRTPRPRAEVDRQWTPFHREFPSTPSAILTSRRSSLSMKSRVRSELAVLVARGARRADRVPSIPVDELARMIVAMTEGSDVQVLTDEAAGADVHADLGRRAVAALLAEFSVPIESVGAETGFTARGAT